MKCRMRVPALMLAVFMILPLSFIAQVSVLSGKIFAENNRQPITLATISLTDEQGALILKISSNYAGNYRTDTLEPGLYFLSVSAGGFEPVERQAVRLIRAQTTIDIALKAKQAEATDVANDEPQPMIGLLSNVLDRLTKGGL